MNEFHQEYIEESKQVLRSLEQSLLHLEKKQEPEEVNNAYRYLHTIKGSAGMFGMTDVERLAHELEAIFSDVRDGIRQLDEFILELTLHAIDVLSIYSMEEMPQNRLNRLFKVFNNLPVVPGVILTPQTKVMNRPAKDSPFF